MRECGGRSDSTNVSYVVDEKSGSTTSTGSTPPRSSVSYDRANPLDLTRKTLPYVDFTKFYENVEKAKRECTLEDDLDFDF